MFISCPYIHLMFPNALILYMVREPMDVLFSAYRLDLNNKDAEGNNNDATSSFVGLAASYGNYRQVMNYWDEVLPGRILHVRYEDLVNDFEAVAKSVILRLLILNGTGQYLSFTKRRGQLIIRPQIKFGKVYVLGLFSDGKSMKNF